MLQYLIISLHPLIDISFMLGAIKKMYKIYINLNNEENLSSPPTLIHMAVVAPSISLTYPVSPFYFFHNTYHHLTYHVCV